MKPSRSSGAPNLGRRSATRADNSPADASLESSGDALTGSPQPQRPSHDDVARRAYQHWENNGRADGNDQDHWFTAEQELRGQSAAPQPEPDVETRRNEP